MRQLFQTLSLFQILSLLTLQLLMAGSLQAKPAGVCALDSKSRKVCVEKPVQRIISLSPGSTELIYSAGAGSKLIAVDSHSDYPEVVNNVPKIGGFPNISVEAITARNPDLIVVWSGGNDPKIARQLEELGLRLFYIDPLTFDEIADTIQSLGRLAGTDAISEKAAKALRKQYLSLKKHYQNSEPVTVFYEIWHDPLMTVSKGQIIGQVIELCGGKNIYADSSIRIPQVNIESLLALNPEVIVSAAGPETENSFVRRWSDWKQMRAVRDDHLITIEGNLISRPTPRALDAARQLCQKLDSVRIKRQQKLLGNQQMHTQGNKK